MINWKNLIYFFIFFMGGKLIFCTKVCAYQDLGSGSYFIQIILAALFGGSFFLTKYWKKVKNFLGRVLKRKADPTDDNK